MNKTRWFVLVFISLIFAGGLLVWTGSDEKGGIIDFFYATFLEPFEEKRWTPNPPEIATSAELYQMVLDNLTAGMTKEQVKGLLGEPVVSDLSCDFLLFRPGLEVMVYFETDGRVKEIKVTDR